TDLTTAGDEILRVGGGNVSVTFHERGAGGSFGTGAGNAVLKVGTMEDTGRSIAAGGTINASGADYAEYFELQDRMLDQPVPKGANLGLDADGRLTDRWADAVRGFLVKSTTPNLVGNDVWGREERVAAKYGIEAPGEPPEIVPDDVDGSEARRAAWRERKAMFDDALEVERRRWDRMALCGQVPVNIEATAEDVGKFLVASEGEGGVVTGVLVSREQLRDNPAAVLDVIGRVVRIAEDGRPVDRKSVV